MCPAHLFYLLNISLVFVVQFMYCTESCILHFVYMCWNIKFKYDTCRLKSLVLLLRGY